MAGEFERKMKNAFDVLTQTSSSDSEDCQDAEGGKGDVKLWLSGSRK